MRLLLPTTANSMSLRSSQPLSHCSLLYPLCRRRRPPPNRIRPFMCHKGHKVTSRTKIRAEPARLRLCVLNKPTTGARKPFLFFVVCEVPFPVSSFSSLPALAPADALIKNVLFQLSCRFVEQVQSGVGSGKCFLPACLGGS